MWTEKIHGGLDGGEVKDYSLIFFTFIHTEWNTYLGMKQLWAHLGS